MIYLASPYSHPDREVMVRRFKQACKMARKLFELGHFVFSPIAHSHPIAEHGELPAKWEYWAAFDTKMISLCDEVWVLKLDGWQKSKGVEAEINIAKGLGKPVKYVDEDALEGK